MHFISVFKVFLSLITQKAHVGALRPQDPPARMHGGGLSVFGPQVSECFTPNPHTVPSGQPVSEDRGVSGTSLSQFVFVTALELDKKGVVETAAVGFRALLSVLGIEAALESLLSVLCTEHSGQSPQ